MVGDVDVGLERTSFGGDPIDAAVALIAFGVADVVLHVADDGVLPVGDIERAIVAKFGISRAEVRIGG